MRLAHEKAPTPGYAISPDGVKSYHDDAQFINDRSLVSPDSGEQTVIVGPMVSFPRSSLLAREDINGTVSTEYKIPEDGQDWGFLLPKDPDYPNVLTVFALDGSKAVRGGRSIGFIIIPLSETEQS